MSFDWQPCYGINSLQDQDDSEDMSAGCTFPDAVAPGGTG